MNENNQIKDQAVALAGIAQSLRIVQHIAWKGQTNDTDFKAVIASLLKINSSSAIDVYSGSFEVSTGLRAIKQQLDTSSSDKDPEFVGLMISILNLHKQLLAEPKVLQRLTNSISQLSQKYSDKNFHSEDEHFESLIKECSQVYKETLSNLPNRIQVKGDPKLLKLESNQMKVRCALLCAMRSVFLWRQSGGSRWHFLFKKKAILNSVKDLISSPRKE